MEYKKIIAGYKKEADPSVSPFTYHDFNTKSFTLNKIGSSVHLPLGTCKEKKLNGNLIEVSVPEWLYNKEIQFFSNSK